MATQLEILIITAANLREAGGLNRLIAAFEANQQTVPTNWGADERAREAYNRATLVERISSWTHNSGTPGLKRRTAPQYRAYFSADPSRLNYVNLEGAKNNSQSASQQLFGLGDALALQLEAVFGVVNLVADASPRITLAASRISARDLQRNGPGAVGARTWLGPHIVNLVGRNTLSAAGLEFVETSWGGVQFDLLPEPLLADVDALVARQQALMEALRPTGIFGDYSASDYEPGSNWIPVPLPTASKR